MINVIHFISGDLWAGAEKMALNLLKVLNKNPDIALMAVLLNSGLLSENLRQHGIRVEVFDESALSIWKLLNKTINIVTEFQPHIIHSHRYKENILAWLCTLSGENRRISVLTTIHGMPEIVDNLKGYTNRFVVTLNHFLVSSRFNIAVAVSEDMKRMLVKQNGFRSNKIEVIPNGIELPGIPLNRGLGPSLRVGSAGRFFPVKDFSFLIDVAREVIQSTEKVYFIIAGEGPQLIDIKDKIKRIGLQKQIILPGFIKDMGVFYQNIDLYLNTSLHEGSPISILEAMSYGLPIVAPNVGGIGEIVEDGKEGFLIAERNPVEFAKKIIKFQDDKHLFMKMSTAARNRVFNEFSSEQMGEKYYELYQRLIAI